MLNNCSNCGGKLEFSPKDKGNKCQSCGTVFPITYDYSFNKKSYTEGIYLKKDEFANECKNIKCKSCGASIILSKYQAQTDCPYCGNTSIKETQAKNIMYIDSIIPFAYDKHEAFTKFKSTVRKRFYANKKMFKNMTEHDIKGAYINAFVFDLNTTNSYSGVFKYTKTITDNEGNKKTVIKHKAVNGIIDKNFQNITVEANSNIDQADLSDILPYEYASAVAFRPDFMQGYMLEYQDRMLEDCAKIAEKIIRKNIERELLKKYKCDSIVELTLNISYNEKKYNYCLLPVYFVNRVYKDKKHTVVMNGQTGAVGSIPSDKWRIFLTIFLSCAFIVAIILGILFMK